MITQATMNSYTTTSGWQKELNPSPRISAEKQGKKFSIIVIV